MHFLRSVSACPLTPPAQCQTPENAVVWYTYMCVLVRVCVFVYVCLHWWPSCVMCGCVPSEFVFLFLLRPSNSAEERERVNRAPPTPGRKWPPRRDSR